MIKIFLLILNISHAGSFLGFNEIGDFGQSTNAKSLSLASIETDIKNPFSFLKNPSTLLNENQIAFSFGYNNFSERIVSPNQQTRYNIFDNINIKSFIFIYGYERIKFGIGYYKKIDYNYKNKKNILNKNEIVGLGYLKSIGWLPSYSLGFNFITEFACFGINYNFYKGNQEIEKKLIKNNITEYYENKSLKISGNNFVIGTTLFPKKKFHLILNFESELKLKLSSSSNILTTTTTTTTYNFNRVIPKIITIGFNYQPQEMDTTLLLEISKQNFKDEFSEADAEKVNYVNVTEIKIGAEHFIKWNFPIRYGIKFLPFYGYKAFESVSFTGGFGFNYKKFEINTGIEFSKRNFVFSAGKKTYIEQNNLYENLFGKNSSVDETFIISAIDIIYRF